MYVLLYVSRGFVVVVFSSVKIANEWYRSLCYTWNLTFESIPNQSSLIHPLSYTQNTPSTFRLNRVMVVVSHSPMFGYVRSHDRAFTFALLHYGSFTCAMFVFFYAMSKPHIKRSPWNKHNLKSWTEQQPATQITQQSKRTATATSKNQKKIKTKGLSRLEQNRDSNSEQYSSYHCLRSTLLVIEQ